MVHARYGRQAKLVGLVLVFFGDIHHKTSLQADRILSNLETVLMSTYSILFVLFQITLLTQQTTWVLYGQASRAISTG